jgi:hypothetical protein
MHSPYDFFLGDNATNSIQLSNISLYHTNSADVMYGWGNGPCTNSYKAICTVRSSAICHTTLC